MKKYLLCGLFFILIFISRLILAADLSAQGNIGKCDQGGESFFNQASYNDFAKEEGFKLWDVDL